VNFVSQSARRLIRAIVPVGARLRLHRLYEALSERMTGLLGRSDPLLPPTSLMFVGGSRRDFRKLGDKWLATFVRVGGLTPSDNVLDVGCGVGRMAVALSGYLNRRFTKDLGGYWVVEGQTPEAAVAYTESDVRRAYRDAGLTIREPIVYGAWSGRADSTSDHSQDIVVAHR
jgi:SAM-dependent methyltransferase